MQGWVCECSNGLFGTALCTDVQAMVSIPLKWSTVPRYSVSDSQHGRNI